MPIRGLRATAYETHKAVYENDFMQSEWVEFMPEGHVAMRNVLFAPLNIEGETVGLIGLANKPTDFTDEDTETASGNSTRSMQGRSWNSWVHPTRNNPSTTRL